MKRVVMALVLLALGTGAVWWWWYGNGPEQDPDRLIVYGNVDIREVRLSFNASEHVGEMYVDEGDTVEENQLLAKLHTARLEAQLDRARAQLGVSKARSVAARSSYDRIASMAERDLASKEQLDEAEAAFKAEEAQVEADEAALAFAEQALLDAELHAPANGVIRERILEPGDMVSPQTPVFTLALTDPVWVRAYLPETALGRARIGAAAEITTDSFPGKVYRGWLGYLSPTAEFTPKNVETPELRTRLVYRIRVFACNPDGELRLGMPATVTLDLSATDAPGRQVCEGG
ncbi:MAG: efflux RND transporter periplasmic adaptor subunit [Gammaproteobacteria bacterium]